MNRKPIHDSLFTYLYWITFASFLILMSIFVSPTFDKSYTWLAIILCILLILTPTDYRFALLTFIAGTGASPTNTTLADADPSPGTAFFLV
jgi:hypothetical protein